MRRHVDPQTYLSGYGTVLEIMGSDLTGTGQIIFMDPPQHNKLRALVSKAFTPGRVAALEERIRQFCAELLDPQVGSRRLRLRRGLRRPASVDWSSPSLLGVSPADRPRVLAPDQHRVPHRARCRHGQRCVLRAQIGLHAYLTEQLADRRRTPQDDLITGADGGGAHRGRAAPPAHRQGSRRLRQPAGQRRHRDRRQAARLGGGDPCRASGPAGRDGRRPSPDPGGGRGAAALRGALPGAGSQRCRVRSSCTARRCRPGAKVLLLTGSAGRDDRAGTGPDEFDIQRKPEQHVSFGIGVHFCLGAALARHGGPGRPRGDAGPFPELDGGRRPRRTAAHQHRARLQLGADRRLTPATPGGERVGGGERRPGGEETPAATPGDELHALHGHTSRQPPAAKAPAPTPGDELHALHGHTSRQPPAAKAPAPTQGDELHALPGTQVVSRRPAAGSRLRQHDSGLGQVPVQQVSGARETPKPLREHHCSRIPGVATHPTAGGPQSCPRRKPSPSDEWP